ncbi:carboxylesterase [Desulforhopalus sp. IMCC35007]|uniref:alpha/beta hydrolase n=1 Tax=Desulforhopalus sp. IMCC35007 TaxID=2569543 RepID=UPI0010AED809|nr:alpha/beta hydrolase [Desulforhopalus sp. IMCC35007]TKB07451.1 alpha/beta fold hydrolase [Desulforhopalus sp. IMCC35007]
MDDIKIVSQDFSYSAIQPTFYTKQSNKKLLAFFLHGFATSPTDLNMLAEAFAEAGFEIHCPTLLGHPMNNSSGVITVDEIKTPILAALNEIDRNEFDIFLIGFSLGASLAIDIAGEVPVSGVLAISPFFQPPNPQMSRFFLKAVSGLPRFRLKRKFQTSTPEARKFLSHEIGTLPILPALEILRGSPLLGKKLKQTKCPVLVVHSFGDKVASFSATAKRIQNSARPGTRLIPMHGLNHFIQFDVCPYILRDLALAHIKGQHSDEVIDPVVFAAIHNTVNEESRHWSGILFKIIIGFFSLFGALLAFTLPEVLTAFWSQNLLSPEDLSSFSQKAIEQKKAYAGAPYYLTAYVFVISLYIIILSLYYMLMNRIDTFIRLHIDPFYSVMSWTQYRTRSASSGKIAGLMIPMLSVPLVLVPLLAAISLIIGISWIYPDRILDFSARNLFLNGFYFSALLLTFCSIGSLYALGVHAKTMVYGTPAPITTTPSVEKLISQLYASVCKGKYAIHKKSGD